MEKLKTFYEECEDMLEEHLLKARNMLRTNNKEYKKLIEKQKEILNKYKNLSLLLETTSEDINLTSREYKVLQDLIQIHFKIKAMEEKEIFLLGARENYFYLKNIRVLE